MEKKMATHPDNLCKGFPGKAGIVNLSGTGDLFEICEKSEI